MIKVSISTLLDICGNCNSGPNSTINCTFTVVSVANGAVVAATAAAGLVAAALAAAIAATLAFKPKSTPANANPLQDQALNNNPAFVTPGLQGDMPAVSAA